MKAVVAPSHTPRMCEQRRVTLTYSSSGVRAAEAFRMRWATTRRGLRMWPPVGSRYSRKSWKKKSKLVMMICAEGGREGVVDESVDKNEDESERVDEGVDEVVDG